MPFLSREDAASLVKMRHSEWVEFQKHWRWLYDSYEGGDRYRYADYFRGPFEPWVDPLYAFGWDQQTGEGFPFSYGMIVQRNLVPHLSDKSTEGRDLYTLRLNRTPVPPLVEFVTERYLSRVFAKQIVRKGPAPVAAWWENVDGKGTAATEWYQDTVFPLLLALGQLDLVFGRPSADPGQEIATRADLKRLGLDGVIASYILPENLVWWKLDRTGAYTEVLAHERDDAGGTVWRHWTATDSNAYDGNGEPVPGKSFAHGLGMVPVVRVFDRRLARCTHSGKSRMVPVAEVMKSVYNRRSELVLDDVQHSHSVLQGPEDFMEADSTIVVGPGGALPMKKNTSGTSVSYQGWEFIDPPKSGAESVRQNVSDELDDVMRHAGLLKPAGMTDGKTVAQSGLSKSFDARDGNDTLTKLASTFAAAETAAARMVVQVASGGKARPADLDAVAIEYPAEFDVVNPQDLAGVLSDLQSLSGAMGNLPETEGEIGKRIVTTALPGVPEGRLRELHQEVVTTARERGAALREAPEASGASPQPGTGQNATQDPSISLPPDASEAIQALGSILAPDMA